MSSVGSNKEGTAPSVTGTSTNASSIDKPTPIKENVVQSEEPVSNDEKESTLTSADLEQDASIRKRKRVVGSDSEVPSTPAAIGQESPVDANILLKRKVKHLKINKGIRLNRNPKIRKTILHLMIH